tara:strand:+ start:2796 stop:3329 length:534 start_codon:yes stop_codon:yes gene_type:complete
MISNMVKNFKSHGDGKFTIKDFRKKGRNVIFEKNVLIFHPENILIGNNVYIGHNTILKSYFKGLITIEDNTWIGQNSFLHGGGEIFIGKNVGIGPSVNIITSYHDIKNIKKFITNNKLIFSKVTIGEGSDIGIGCTILPGIKIGKQCMIGANSLVNKNIPDNYLAAGNPIKLIRKLK